VATGDIAVEDVFIIVGACGAGVFSRVEWTTPLLVEAQIAVAPPPIALPEVTAARVLCRVDAQTGEITLHE
jgi:hypothetical protein